MFFVRVHEWSVKMLAQVITLRDVHPEVELSFDDQSAFSWVLGRPGFEEFTIYQPHNWWNSFGLQGKPFDHDRFVLHFAGVGCCGGEDKGTSMVRWLDLIETDPDHYYRPLSNLSIQAEITQYWDTAISAQKMLEASDKWPSEVKYNKKEVENARGDILKTLFKDADDPAKVKASVAKLQEIERLANTKAANKESKSTAPATDEKKQKQGG